MCEQEAFLCCTKLQKIKVINALTSVRHVSTCLSCSNTHARLFNWAACAAQFVQPSSYVRSFLLYGGRGVFLAICGGDVPSDFLNTHPRLYLRPISIRPM